MADLLSSILVSVVGFLIGGLIMTVIGSVTIKFFVRRAVNEVVSDETKEKVIRWIEEGFRNGIDRALQDEEIRKILLEILKVGEKKIKGGEKS